MILVAEDNAINQQVILHQLTLLGYAAEAADNGRTALERWQSGDYALLLTDLYMPEMGGYQLAAAIRSLEPRGCRAPIIALTGNPGEDETERCRAAGMDDCLSKPVELTSLQQLLGKWLPLQPAAMQSADELAPGSPDPADARPILDTDALVALVGEDPVVIRHFLLDYRHRATQTLRELLVAHAKYDLPQLGSQAHKLKSSSLAVGAIALGKLCGELEQASHAGLHALVSSLLVSIDNEIAVVAEYIEALLAGAPAGPA